MSNLRGDPTILLDTLRARSRGAYFEGVHSRIVGQDRYKGHLTGSKWAHRLIMTVQPTEWGTVSEMRGGGQK